FFVLVEGVFFVVVVVVVSDEGVAINTTWSPVFMVLKVEAFLSFRNLVALVIFTFTVCLASVSTVTESLPMDLTVPSMRVSFPVPFAKAPLTASTTKNNATGIVDL